MKYYDAALDPNMIQRVYIIKTNEVFTKLIDPVAIPKKIDLVGIHLELVSWRNRGW